MRCSLALSDVINTLMPSSEALRVQAVILEVFLDTVVREDRVQNDKSAVKILVKVK